jgi:pimeloyl-ACP methyl ester carboxylesterase
MGSTGVYSFRREAEDIHSIVNYLKIEHNYSNIGLFGRSAGTIASILYSVEHSDKIKSLALWETPTHVYGKHYRDEVPRKQMFESLQQEGVKIMDELFLKDVINPDDIISQVKLPILIVWGTADIKYSSIEEQLELFSQIGSNICGLFFIKGATHLIDSSDSKFETYANIFISWFKMTLHMGS